MPSKIITFRSNSIGQCGSGEEGNCGQKATVKLTRLYGDDMVSLSLCELHYEEWQEMHPLGEEHV